MESAAAFTNAILDVQATCSGKKPSLEQIRRALKTYESSRRARAKEYCVSASHHTRLEAMETEKDKYMARYVVPKIGDALADTICSRATGAVVVRRLPFPKRALRATLPYDTNSGIGKEEQRKLRALFALPLLGIALYVQYLVFLRQPSSLLDIVQPVALDLNSLEESWTIRLLADLVPLQLIWAIESVRRGNVKTLPSYGPFLVGGLSQILGLGVVGPLYNFVHYVQSPQEKYRAKDNRMVPLGDAKVLLPAIGLGYIAPTLALFLPLSTGAHQIAVRIWQLFPVWTTIAHRVLKATVTDTTKRDRIEAPTKDLPLLRRAYLLVGCACGAIYTRLNFTSPGSWRRSWQEALTSVTHPTTSGSGAASQILAPNHVVALGSSLVWVLLNFRDLKKASKTKLSWVEPVAGLLTTAVLFGPGAALCFGWYWRESIMAADMPSPPVTWTAPAKPQV